MNSTGNEAQIAAILALMEKKNSAKEMISVGIGEGIRILEGSEGIVYFYVTSRDDFNATYATSRDGFSVEPAIRTTSQSTHNRANIPPVPSPVADYRKELALRCLRNKASLSQTEDNGNTVLFVPIIWDTDILAVLCIARDSLKPFTMEDTAFVEALAEALIPSIVRYKVYFYDSFEGIIISRHSRIVEFNSRASRILGYSPDEVIDKVDVRKIYDDPAHADEVKARLTSSNVVSHHYTTLRTKHGQKLDVHLHLQKLPGDQIVGRFSDRRRWLKGIDRIVSIISTQPKSPRELTKSIIATIEELSNGSNVGLLFPNKKGTKFIPFYIRAREQSKRYKAVDLDEGICGYVFSRKPEDLNYQKPYYAANVDTEEHIGKFFRVISTTKSEYCIPLVGHEGKTIGVLDIQSDVMDCFTSEDRQFLETIANTVAHIIDSYKEGKENEREHTRRITQFKSANNAVALTLNRRDRDGAFHRAILTEANFAVRKIGKKHPILSMLYLLEGTELKVATWAPRDKQNLEKYNAATRDLVKDRTGIVGRAAKTGKTQNVTNVHKNNDYFKIIPEVMSEIAVPILFNEKVIGVLNFEHEEENFFDDFDQASLELFAGVVSNAVKHMERREELESFNALLNKILPSIAPVHEMRGNVGLLKGYLNLIEADVEDIATEVDGNISGRLLDNIRFISDVFDGTIFPNAETEGPCDVDTVIQAKIESLMQSSSYFDSIDVSFEPNCKGELARINSVWLAYLMRTLISNARKAIRKKLDRTSRDSIKILTRVAGSSIQILIEDSGGGVKKHLQAKLFKEHIPKKDKEDGMGLGLWTCSAILTAVGGKIELTGNSENRGAIFQITLERCLKQ